MEEFLACSLLKVTFLHGCFSYFLNWANGTMSRNASLILIMKITITPHRGKKRFKIVVRKNSDAYLGPCQTVAKTLRLIKSSFIDVWLLWSSLGSPYSPSYLPLQHPLKHRSENHELIWVFTNDPTSNKMIKEEFYFEQVRNHLQISLLILSEFNWIN